MDQSLTPRAVVAGIDGSFAAIQAALWSVNEALSRDIPLRLLHAIADDDNHRDAGDRARRLATAEIALREAAVAVEASDRPVKIEMEIAHGSALSTLVRASASAAMIVVGAIGFRTFQRGRVGSTAAALARRAHCPVAIVRHRDGPTGRHADHIFAVVDESPDDGVVLETAMQEARLRNGRARVLVCWQSRPGSGGEKPSISDANNHIRANLDARIDRWRRRYPDVETDAVAVHQDIGSYLAAHSGSAQLVIVGARDHRDVATLFAPTGNAALHPSHCSVLVVDHQHL